MEDYHIEVSVEDDNAVRAPITRLRRRLSVEHSEDTNSPKPATPSKKRAGKLATKPQLELIDENSPGSNSKNSTKKTVVKDLTEITAENPVTPSRRSARIKSNTSIVSETTKSYESPRAKRAARRTSQAGSDTETSITPAKPTRRTRKDSASSMDKLETTLASKPTNITEVIIEETETNSQMLVNSLNGDDNSDLSIRKSPRLKDKKQQEVSKRYKSQEVINEVVSDTVNELNLIKKDDNPLATKETTKEESDYKDSAPETIDKELSDATAYKIKNLVTVPKNKSSYLNKSTSALDSKKERSGFTNKRQRTKSLTPITQNQINDVIFNSDNENSKGKIRKSLVSKALILNISGSGDNQSNCHDNTHNQSMLLHNDKDTSNGELKISKNNEYLNDDGTKSNTWNNTKEKAILDKSLVNSPLKSKIDETNIIVTNDDTNTNTKIIEKSLNITQSSVLFENSSGTDVKKKSPEILLDSGDQCVPVVVTVECTSVDNIEDDTYMEARNSCIKAAIKNTSTENKTKNISRNDSCEPMDIDETIPNNITICDASQLEQSNINQNKKTINTSNHNEGSLHKSSNTSLNLEKTQNENKSTLIISQIKDLSSAENSVSKSPNNKCPDEKLSKSSNYYSVQNKKCDKKNISSDYSTSTPLQQKKLKKLGMQINTSIIDCSNNEHKRLTKDLGKSKKEVSGTSKNSDTSSSAEEQINESSETISNLLDDAAKVASDDYESGDSQDEDDKEYEKENEILVKGESLNSTDEMSNDTDYEKDSFVVSSNEDDDELLSGTGDDLSMSDNELTMSMKSKQKYNKRKLKDQKKASKEMFEARHNINVSKHKLTRKSQKLNSSSDSDSENDIIAPIKKYKNQRLDSTHEDSMEQSHASRNIPKKKRLSDSPHSEQDYKEHEISTVFERSVTQTDPLSVQVKLEPKTPMKGLNMSTVQIYDNIEEVVVDNNASITKTNQTQDALHITITNEDDDSSVNEDCEIMKNYESVLNELNIEEKTKVKAHDISLNLNKTKKKHSREPILDQLNLTDSKSWKKKSENFANDYKPGNKQKDKTISIHTDKDTSSDSIDLQLFFPEENSDFDEMVVTEKKSDDFIPLKRTPGKINILNKDNESAENNNPDELHFIIDTEGTRGNNTESSNDINSTSKTKKNKNNKSFNNSPEAPVVSEQADMSIQESTKKKKKSSIYHTENTNTNNKQPDDTLVEISYKSKKHNKIRKSIETDQITADNSIMNTAVDTSYKGSTKKKKNISLSLTEDLITNVSTPVQCVDSAKKKKKLSESTEMGAIETSLQISNSGKKKKKSYSESQSESIDDGAIETSLQISNSGKKKKKSYSESQSESIDDGAIETSLQTSNSGKKNKKSYSESQPESIDDGAIETSLQISNSGKKKKKSYSESQSESIDDGAIETSLQISNSGKKKKKSYSESQSESIDIGVIETSLQIANSSKKKKKSLSESQSEPIIEDTLTKPQNIYIPNTKKPNRSLTDNTEGATGDSSCLYELSNSKKRKRKSSIQNKDEVVDKNQVLDVSQPLNTSISIDRQKKKRKLSDNIDIYTYQDNETVKKGINNNLETSNDYKKTTHMINEEQCIQSAHESDHQRKKNKKRKREDDDIITEASKVLKQNSFEKVNRLPTSILNQLDDKPKKEVLENKKSMIISTTSFVVQETRKRKNKPSNYLEESVYLNDSNNDKKYKSNIKKPKVLPFVPTVKTSGSGFTTNFQIKIIPQKVEFVAQTKNEANFKNEYLYGKKIKRLGTYEMYKKQRSAKMSKF